MKNHISCFLAFCFVLISIASNAAIYYVSSFRPDSMSLQGNLTSIPHFQFFKAKLPMNYSAKYPM